MIKPAMLAILMAFAALSCTTTRRSSVGTFVSDVNLRGQTLEIATCELEYVESVDHLDGWDFLILLLTFGAVEGYQDEEHYLRKHACTQRAEVLP